MTTKKKKEMTPQDRKTLGKASVLAAVFVCFVCLCVVVYFNNYLLRDKGYSAVQEETISLAKLLKVLPGSRWNLAEKNISSGAVPSFLEGSPVVLFQSDLKTVCIEQNGYVWQGQFELLDSCNGIIRVMDREFSVRFSDMESESYDENSYIMRLYYEDWGYFDFFIQDL